jgi:hypothetical protein
MIINGAYRMTPTGALKSAIGVGAMAVAGFAFLRWNPMPLTMAPNNIAMSLAPLLLTAAFIERAVEIFVSSLRDADSATLRNQITAAQALAVPDAKAVLEAQAKLAEYRGATQKYAFSSAFLLGLLAAFVGVRSLGLFLPAVLPATIGKGQLGAFSVFDVVLTAALLAGGAHGLHAPINAFTSFFNASASNNLQSQNS